MAELKVEPQLLVAQARRFSERSAELEDALKKSVHALEQLANEGLGWDQTGRTFSLPFWAQQSRVVEAIGDAIAVLAEVDRGLTGMAKLLPDADATGAELFLRLRRRLETSPSIELNRLGLTDVGGA